MPIKTTLDSVGRIVVPKALRDAFGLVPRSTVDISRYRRLTDRRLRG